MAGLMRVTDVFIKWLTKNEGFSANAFWDVNHYSIGYGTHASSANEGPITKEEAERRMMDHINEQIYSNSATKKTFQNVNLSQNQSDAITSFAYNHGSLTTGDKNNGVVKLAKAIQNNPNDFETIKSLWAELCINKGTSAESGLRRRRQEELQIYCDNVYPLSNGDVTGTGGTSSTSTTGGGLYLGDMTDSKNRVYIRNMMVDESLGLNKVYHLAGKTHKVGLLEQSKKRKKQFEVLSSLVTKSGKEMGRNIIIDDEYFDVSILKGDQTSRIRR